LLSVTIICRVENMVITGDGELGFGSGEGA